MSRVTALKPGYYGAGSYEYAPPAPTICIRPPLRRLSLRHQSTPPLISQRRHPAFAVSKHGPSLARRHSPPSPPAHLRPLPSSALSRSPRLLPTAAPSRTFHHCFLPHSATHTSITAPCTHDPPFAPASVSTTSVRTSRFASDNHIYTVPRHPISLYTRRPSLSFSIPAIQTTSARRGALPPTAGVVGMHLTRISATRKLDAAKRRSRCVHALGSWAHPTHLRTFAIPAPSRSMQPRRAESMDTRYPSVLLDDIGGNRDTEDRCWEVLDADDDEKRGQRGARANQSSPTRRSHVGPIRRVQGLLTTCGRCDGPKHAAGPPAKSGSQVNDDPTTTACPRSESGRWRVWTTEGTGTGEYPFDADYEKSSQGLPETPDPSPLPFTTSPLGSAPCPSASRPSAPRPPGNRTDDANDPPFDSLASLSSPTPPLDDRRLCTIDVHGTPTTPIQHPRQTRYSPKNHTAPSASTSTPSTSSPRPQHPRDTPTIVSAPSITSPTTDAILDSARRGGRDERAREGRGVRRTQRQPAMDRMSPVSTAASLTKAWMATAATTAGFIAALRTSKRALGRQDPFTP
ncbi:hypothetical protein FA13DRAFT_1789745 [Coprinellus micaceus]|uniref:Uncharacterized protein n=1 Tax=Coprinellus micaceus TaxID=71717 RepID=A0A4Y7TIE1_COPMI|nr:hypothetical protein FA13DRAFT_1789745 [Coprinellus micaceus]